MVKKPKKWIAFSKLVKRNKKEINKFKPCPLCGGEVGQVHKWAFIFPGHPAGYPNCQKCKHRFKPYEKKNKEGFLILKPSKK